MSRYQKWDGAGSSSEPGAAAVAEGRGMPKAEDFPRCGALGTWRRAGALGW